MAIQLTTTGALSDEMKTYYDRVLLERALPELRHTQFGQRRPISRRNGKIIEFRKFSSLGAATTALTEGTPPTSQNLTVTATTATIAQYGGVVEGSDLLDLTAIDPVLQETAQLLGEQAGLSVDRIVRDILAAGTSVQYANGKASRITVAAGDLLTVTEIRKAVRTLKNNNARTINGSYVAIVGPNTTYTLQNDTDWKNAQQYAGSTRIFNGEIGEMYGVRFVETTEAKVFTGSGAAGIDVYATLVFGADAYGIVPLDGADLGFYFKGLGSGGTADPIDQKWSSGWKVSMTAKILQDIFMTRIEHAVS